MRTFKNENQVKKISIGTLFPTDTILETSFIEEVYNVEAILKISDLKTKFSLNFELSEDDCIYGLGENLRGINKRGYQYESFCSDESKHLPGKTSLYAAHNFFIIHGKTNLGVYIDFSGKITYDIGFSSTDAMSILVAGKDFDIYIYEGSLNEIVKQFRTSLGMNYVPPKWGFGYQQSRWSYENADIVNEIASGFEVYDIPCDAIYLDIDYMERFKDFTVSDERFPHFKSFVSHFLEKDIKLIPIIDAGVKIEADYDVYEEGIKNDYFCTDSEGKPFVAAVWPGKVHFPDFLNPDARKWFGSKYQFLLDQGIKGFWNDMNEPAIFYSEKRLKETFEWLKAHENKNLDIYSFFEMIEKVNGLSNAVEDYKSLYHKVEGEPVNHYDVHNLYGYNMTRAADEGFKQYDDNQRVLLITRASHVGMAKHSGIWTGDNHSWWEHLKLNIQMMPSLNMVGFLYAGADTGGFQDDVSPDLMVRWMQFSLFTPLLRNHSALGTKMQEPWRFEKKIRQQLRDVIRLRYAFVPYLYSEFMKASIEFNMMFKPLSFEYADSESKAIEDQLLVGDALMIAPVYEQNAKGRMVYLPEKMLLWKASTFEAIKADQFEAVEAGYHYIKADLSELFIFIRPGKLLPLVEPMDRVSKLKTNEFIVIGYGSEKANYALYEDDGESFDFKAGKYNISTLEVDQNQVVTSNNDGHIIKTSFLF
ncbi:TIM-barrel domain-containing protein [Fusibacter sp. 3D3]|uniref:TIM-barrel domain-containing protein n=1 Tax=Fusibacter sp. 3D3 TaxID=1048380 RepID=UPI0008538402|nr:TIM-barrel domain-containing protein [Fusibacter sp. 3D3]GAU79733.1 alpha-glucosidase [Fusibacter sp. 3D3]